MVSFLFLIFRKKSFCLDADAKEAQEAYRKVVTYFGETSKTMPPETFFPMFDRFIKAYAKAENDLEKWNLLQQKNLEKRQAVCFYFQNRCSFIVRGLKRF